MCDTQTINNRPNCGGKELGICNILNSCFAFCLAKIAVISIINFSTSIPEHLEDDKHNFIANVLILVFFIVLLAKKDVYETQLKKYIKLHRQYTKAGTAYKKKQVLYLELYHQYSKVSTEYGKVKEELEALKKKVAEAKTTIKPEASKQATEVMEQDKLIVLDWSLVDAMEGK